jgi:hypothetical protein
LVVCQRCDGGRPLERSRIECLSAASGDGVVEEAE